ncbi:MAG: TIGR01777 family oxidoreductase [Porticoccaceae bacterium]
MVIPANCHVLVTGGTGFIGRNLCPRLLARGCQVTVLTRDAGRAATVLPTGIRFIEHIPQLGDGPFVNAVVNLAGEPLAGRRWTDGRKRRFEESRTGLTKTLFSYFAESRERAPRVLISGSAIGFYGPQDDNLLTESASQTPSFSSRLCTGWENAACMFEILYTRVVRLRTGVVLGDGGALAAMLPAFRAGAGGAMASGKQWMSWIHVEDMVRIIEFCLYQEALHGPVNATAPVPVTNREFASQLARTLGRPAILRMPAPVLRLLFGEMAEELLIAGQRVVPAALLKAGYHFAYPELEPALRQILGK